MRVDAERVGQVMPEQCLQPVLGPEEAECHDRRRNSEDRGERDQHQISPATQIDRFRHGVHQGTALPVVLPSAGRNSTPNRDEHSSNGLTWPPSATL